VTADLYFLCPNAIVSISIRSRFILNHILIKIWPRWHGHAPIRSNPGSATVEIFIESSEGWSKRNILACFGSIKNMLNHVTRAKNDSNFSVWSLKNIGLPLLLLKFYIHEYQYKRAYYNGEPWCLDRDYIIIHLRK